MHAIALQSAIAAGSSGVDSILLSGLAVLPLLAWLLLVVAALISILASPQTFGMKIVWAVFVFIAPFIGSVLWFLVGRGNARRTAHGHHVHVHH